MIEVRGVTKYYGDTLAVDDVSFSVGEGEIVGFLGPNGAGKSTLLKVISTWLPPTRGTVEVAGHDVRTAAPAVRRALGYLPEHNALYDTMRVDRFLAFVGKIRGLSGSALRARIAWAVDACHLELVVDKRVNQCSKGNRQRVGLAAALLHDPPVIVLDEPTHGLDPLQVVSFLQFVKSLSAGRAIIFSNHILSEVTAIADRLVIINRGTLLADSTMDQLQSQAEERSVPLDEVVLDIVRSARRLVRGSEEVSHV